LKLSPRFISNLKEEYGVSIAATKEQEEMEERDFWFCRSFENVSKKVNKGYFPFFKLGYITIGWSNCMAQLEVMNFPFSDDKDVRVCRGREVKGEGKER
jgi:hypothetical protein